MILFNKDNRGSEELYELSGTFQASTNFAAIETEVESAINEVTKIFGAPIITLAQQIYEKQNPTEDEKTLLRLVRRPIAFHAIRNYSKITGLTHGSTGRRITVGDNEKVPFEWMIDRDDREMQERYYRALDALFFYLANKQEVPDAWKESEIYKRLSGSTIATLDEMERIYPVNHSYYTFFTLLPLMRETQQHMESLLASGKNAAGTMPDATKEKCKKYVVLGAITKALRRWSISIFPSEVARQFAPSYQGNRESRAAAMEEIEWSIQHLEKEANDVLSEIMDDIGNNPYDEFPLIPKNVPGQKYFTT